MYQTFCQTLFHMTWTASEAALAVMVLRLFLRGVPRAVVCGLWLVVFLRMVCPVSFTLPVSLMPEPPAGFSGERFTVMGFTDRAEEIPELAEPRSWLVEPDPETGEPGVAITRTVDPYPIAVGLWAAGAAGMLLWSGVSYARLRRRLAEAVWVEEGVYESDRIDSPFVCGFLRPRIYLPAGLAGEDRRYALLHERAHIARGDHLAKPLAWLALSVHWFDPVLWLAFCLYGRDLETACDQRVIRGFGREEVSGYAAALLHLGRDRGIPRAIPHAFGEAGARGRIRHVLSYRHPALFVVIPAIVLCAVLAILLLADPGERNGQLSGIEIVQGQILDQGVPVELPEDLRDEAVDLVRRYDTGDYRTIEAYTPAAGDVILTNASRVTRFCLTEAPDGTPAVVRTNHNQDGYTSARRMQPMPGLAEDPDWQAWKGKLRYYLETGRADELYALKTPYIGDPVAVGRILSALRVRDVVGEYTMELRTDREPYGLSLVLASPPAEEEQSRIRRYEQAAAPVILSLIENGETFSIRYDGSAEAPASMPLEGKPESPEAFLHIYRTYRESLAEGTGQAMLESGTYTLGETQYLSEEMPYRSVGKYTGSVTISPEVFSVVFTHPLSSAWPMAEAAVPSPVYSVGALGPEGIEAPDGTVIPTEDCRERQEIRILDEEGGGPGCRLYRLDGELWLGYGDGDLEALFRLVPAEG